MIFFVGIFAAYYIAKLPQILKGILDVILTLSLVLPPTVVGYLLLRAGRMLPIVQSRRQPSSRGCRTAAP